MGAEEFFVDHGWFELGATFDCEGCDVDVAGVG